MKKPKTITSHGIDYYSVSDAREWLEYHGIKTYDVEYGSFGYNTTGSSGIFFGPPFAESIDEMVSPIQYNNFLRDYGSSILAGSLVLIGVLVVALCK